MIVVVGGEKGGVGKTRTSTHVAYLAVEEGVDAALLDTDRQGSAVSWCRIRNESEHQPTIPCFPLSVNAVKEIVELSKKFDLLVVDIGAQNYRTMLEMASIADMVLVPCGPDQQELESTLTVFSALSEISALRATPLNAHVILTRTSVRENSKATKEMYGLFEQCNIPVFESTLANREAWRASGKTGLSVCELTGKEYSEKANMEIRSVYNEIKKKVKSNGN
ncbi:division plane positioning ATPase MipZ [Flavobacterium sp.]|uniref:nucleotide-binding protein n=1 Tax=Flavobacterium sp. TaxID=239 RepID=UPI0026349E38|nr:division plane positioning ATPase MipZ [Flavobacterium sp.]